MSFPRRKYWNEYMKAYQACLSATSTTDSPWYAVPADDKRNTRLIISQIILGTLKGLKMEYPKLTKEHRKELQELRKLLAK
jgi:polyphosphate kinase 2 (PPK2 family)